MKDLLKIKLEPKEIFEEFKIGNSYKSSLGDKGLFEQSKINERFFIGDQWYGAQCGNSRPLVRRNVIKRIGEYKMSCVGSAPIAVNYNIAGMPDNKEMIEDISAVKEDMINNGLPSGEVQPPEASVISSAMSDYFKTTAERVKFEKAKLQILKNAYISGTGIAYTYWDSNINTGLFADNGKKQAIKGDIAFEVLNVENVVFGDPNNDDIESQPYIILCQRKNVADVIREAKANGQKTDDIKPDRTTLYGNEEENEYSNGNKITVLTKIYKKHNNGKIQVCAIRTVENAVIRPEWDMLINRYPIAKFSWESRKNSAYGESEITYMIPNQIAINRALTAEIWSALSVGMPKLLVNGDLIQENITNDPGQIIKVYAGEGNLAGALHYVNPPYYAAQFQNVVNDLADKTMSDAGANEAALGNIRPDNATAIIQMREAALQPMQIYQSRFYDFIEDIARIWSSFWINMYGARQLKISDRNGISFMPFNGERYKNLLFNAKIDVGASTLWSEAVVISTLDSMLTAGLITFDQYLERLPGGLIPDITGLREDIANQQQAAEQQETNNDDVLRMLAEQYPDRYKEFINLPKEQQDEMLRQIAGGIEQ